MKSRWASKSVAAAAVWLLVSAAVQAATYTSPRQNLALYDVYQLNPDGFTGGEGTTEPKVDLNDGLNGDNKFYKRTNVARAWPYGCAQPYWYTSAYQEAGEPDPAGPQYVDYAPPFGANSNQLPPGRYRLNAQYRFTDARAYYPAEYTVNHAGGSTTILQSQREGTPDACESFDLGEFDLQSGSFIHVNDTGTESITFNRMLFTYLGPPGGVPYVNAGSDQTIVLPAAANLQGTALDADGQPGPLTTTWSMAGGPGTVTFGDPNAPETTATFSMDGVYTLRLTASDTLNAPYDEATVTVLPAGSCQLQVTPNCGTDRQSTDYSILRTYCVKYDNPVAPMEFTLTNTGAGPIDYAVTEITNATDTTPADYAWLSVVNPTGTLPPQSSVVVTATVDPAGLATPADPGSNLANNGFLAFGETNCGMVPITRKVCVTAMGVDNTSLHTYQGDMDPLTLGSAGDPAGGYNFVVEEGAANGFVEDDPDAIDGKAWRIIDDGSSKVKYRAARAAAAGLDDPVPNARIGGTVVARVKVRSHVDPREGALFLWNNRMTSSYHWGDNGPDGVIIEINRGAQVILPGQFDQEFHILRMTAIGDRVCNRVINFYFDEDVSPVAVLTIPEASTVAATGNSGLGFGAGSTLGSYDISFDWVSLTNAGAFAPGEEVAVLGQSLVLGRDCPRPYVDHNEDGFVDMLDFAELQRCFNGLTNNPAPLQPGCDCFDNANPRGLVDEFDVNYFLDCASGPRLPWTESLECPN